jgi:hypothetical protein
MMDFTWKVFCMTGNIDTYLLFKELKGEVDHQENQSDVEEGMNQLPAGP